MHCFQELKKGPELTVFSDMRHMIIPYLALYFVCIWLRSCLDLDEIARGKILERALEASERVAGLRNAYIYILYRVVNPAFSYANEKTAYRQTVNFCCSILKCVLCCV